MTFRTFRLFTALLALSASATAWSQGYLYAVDGSGGEDANIGNSSTLYQLDPADGSVIRVIGDIGYPHVTGLAVNPQTGVLYGVVSDMFYSGDGLLITIDRNTGQGTLVGPHNSQLPDISFSSDGTLYAWNECYTDGVNTDTCLEQDDLYTLDLQTGAATKVGECACGTSATGLAFDASDTLYMKSITLNLMDASTGTIVSSVGMGSGTHNLLTFGPGNVALTGQRISDQTQFELKSVNVDTGATQSLGTNDVAYLSAIEYTVTSPQGNPPVPALRTPAALLLMLLLALSAIAVTWRKHRV